MSKEPVMQWRNDDPLRGNPDGSYELKGGPTFPQQVRLSNCEFNGLKLDASGQPGEPIRFTMENGRMLEYLFEGGIWFRLNSDEESKSEHPTSNGAHTSSVSRTPSPMCIMSSDTFPCNIVLGGHNFRIYGYGASAQFAEATGGMCVFLRRKFLNVNDWEPRHTIFSCQDVRQGVTRALPKLDGWARDVGGVDNVALCYLHTSALNEAELELLSDRIFREHHPGAKVSFKQSQAPPIQTEGEQCKTLKPTALSGPGGWPALPVWKMSLEGSRRKVGNGPDLQLWEEASTSMPGDAPMSAIAWEFATRSENAGLGKPWMDWGNDSSCRFYHCKELGGDWRYVIATQFDRIGARVNIRFTGQTVRLTNFRWRFWERAKWVVAPWLALSMVMSISLGRNDPSEEAMIICGAAIMSFVVYMAYKNAAIDFNYVTAGHSLRTKIVWVVKRVAVTVLMVPCLCSSIMVCILQAFGDSPGAHGKLTAQLGMSPFTIMACGPVTIYILLHWIIRSRCSVNHPTGGYFENSHYKTTGFFQAVCGLVRAG